MSAANPDNPAVLVPADSRIAFQAPTTNLWLAQEDTHLGMMPGTSPSIVPSGAGVQQKSPSRLATAGLVLRVLAWVFAALFIVGFTSAVRKT